MALQRTITKEFTLSGKGLHTGLQIEATFYPAPEDNGIKFYRTDLPQEVEIPALADYVSATERGTVISKGDAKVSTIEHAMSALYALGIDNCNIKVNAPELPILDGSAIMYVNAINEVGYIEQNKEKDYFYVQEKIEYKMENGSSLTIMPDDKFSIETLIDFDSPILSNQFASLENIADYEKEIASARTFVFVREIEPLLQHNLIKGGDLNNAIVIYDKEMSNEALNNLTNLIGIENIEVKQLGYLNPRPLTWKNEPARHKLLDVIGDLALIGRPICGKVIAYKPGHTVNSAIAKAIRKDLRRKEVMAPSFDPSKTPLMDIHRIKELLPHRWPMLLVDKVMDISEKSIVAVKNVTNDETFFMGHFPNEPVMPGVLMVEAMAQAGGLLVLSKQDDPTGYSTYLMKIDNVKFRQKVVPGDTLVFKVTITTEIRRGCAYMQGYTFVNGILVAEATYFAQISKNK